MKTLILYLALFIILISTQGAGCSKTDEPAADSGLNSVEKLIQGVWFLKSKNDTLLMKDTTSGKMKLKKSTVYESFQGTPYIELKTSKKTKESLLAQSNAKDANSAGTNMGDTSLNAMLYVTKLAYWLYDQNVGMFVWNSFHMKLLTATDKDLEIRYGAPMKDSTWTITWKFVR